MRSPALLLAALLLLSGCAGTAPSPENSPRPAPSVTVAETAAPATAQWYFWEDSDPPSVFRTVTVGDSSSSTFEGTTRVIVANLGQNRTLNVTMAHGPGNTTIYERGTQFPADAALAFEMAQAGRYAVTVEHANGSGTMVLNGDDFDCNEQTHAIWVTEPGSVEDSYGTTDLACSVTTA